jgi:hypothetical protein
MNIFILLVKRSNNNYLSLENNKIVLRLSSHISMILYLLIKYYQSLMMPYFYLIFVNELTSDIHIN